MLLTAPRPPAAVVVALLAAASVNLFACVEIEVQNAFEAAFQGRCDHDSPCEHLCQDLHDGMFECDCREGFVLNRNGYGCLELNSTLEAAAEAAEEGTGDATADGDGDAGADPPQDPEEDILYQKDASFSAELDAGLIGGTDDTALDDGDSNNVKDDPNGAIADAGTVTPPRVQFVTTQSPNLAQKVPGAGGGAGAGGGGGGDTRPVTTESLEAGAGAAACALDCGVGGACVLEPVDGVLASPPTPSGPAPRCQCPLGRGGDRCDAEVEVRSPRFSGQGWLAFPALRAAYKHVQLELEFRPEAWDGILFLTGERDDMAGDFMALLLHRGFVEFRFDCGSGLGVVRSEETVLLNQWNRLTLSRHRWDAWIQLNNGKHVQGRSKGLFSRITFREPLFLGGPGNTTGLADKLPTEDGLRGCIRRLEVNDHAYSFSLAPLGDAVKGFDVEECSADRCSRVPCQHGGKCVTSGDAAICLCPLGFTGDLCEVRVDLQVPAFNGSSYLRYPGLAGTALSWLDVQITLKPTAPDGVILYNGRRSDGVGDFVAIYMSDGHLEFTFDLGTGAATIRSAGKATLGAWHELRLSRTGRLAVLQLDREPPAQALAPGAFTQLSLPQSLYIGGVPNFELVSPKVRVRSSFVGCIQKVVVNGRPLQIVSAALGGVNVDNCPHPCAAQPCGRGGQCVPERDSYSCECGGGGGGGGAGGDGSGEARVLSADAGQCPGPEEQPDGPAPPPPPPAARPHVAHAALVSRHVVHAGEVGIPRFTGHSYLHYSDPDTLRRIVSYKTSINMRFRTRSASGLLLWSGHTRLAPAGDFLALGVAAGHLHFRFNLGGGEVTIVYNGTRIDDGLWHRLRAVRYEQEGSLTVDNGPAVSQRAPGSMRQLNTHTGLYLGGMADIEHATMKKYTSGMVGCISDLILDTDYHVQLMQMATASKNIERCG